MNKVYIHPEGRPRPDDNKTFAEALEYLTQSWAVTVMGDSGMYRCKPMRGPFGDYHFGVIWNAVLSDTDSSCTVPTAEKALALAVAMAEGAERTVERALEIMAEHEKGKTT